MSPPRCVSSGHVDTVSMLTGHCKGWFCIQAMWTRVPSCTCLYSLLGRHVQHSRSVRTSPIRTRPVPVESADSCWHYPLKNVGAQSPAFLSPPALFMSSTNQSVLKSSQRSQAIFVPKPAPEAVTAWIPTSVLAVGCRSRLARHVCTPAMPFQMLLFQRLLAS